MSHNPADIVIKAHRELRFLDQSVEKIEKTEWPEPLKTAMMAAAEHLRIVTDILRFDLQDYIEKNLPIVEKKIK